MLGPRRRSRGGSSRSIAEPVQALAGARAHARAHGDALDEAHQLDVEERHALLQPRRHRHLVVAEQDAVGQEHARVEVQRLLKQRPAGDVAEHVLGAGQALGGRLARRPSPVSAPRVSASVISTSRSSRSAFERPPSRWAPRRARAARGSSRAAAPTGPASAAGTARSGPSSGGRLVAPVAAVRLVGALAGEHDLHVLGGEARELQQGGRRGDAAGLLQARHAARQLGKEVGLLHRGVVVVGADDARARGRRRRARRARRRGRGSRS